MSLVSYGWNPRVAALAAEHPDLPVARVVRVDVDRCLVATDDGLTTARAEPLPVVGDWVILAAHDDGHDRGPAIMAVLPRWSALTRGQGDEAQVMAADVDGVAVTAPLDRPLSLTRIERELMIAWDAPATPVIVLTKADAHPDPDAAVAEVEQRCSGVEVIVTSALEGRGVERLAERLAPDRTVVLFGASGAGKSTLANRLLGTDVQSTGAVREHDSRGRHTTSARHLLPVPGGGVLLDTPGVRSLALWGDGGVEAVFGDIEALASSCRFRDCAHDTEPGCAVIAAVVAGELDGERLASYRKLQRELAFVDRQNDPAARAEHARKWKQLAKAGRQKARGR